jgi:hypothetical protein
MDLLKLNLSRSVRAEAERVRCEHRVVAAGVLYYLSHVDRIYYLALHTALWRLDHAIPLTLWGYIWLATRTSERLCKRFAPTSLLLPASTPNNQPLPATDQTGHTPVDVFFKWEILNYCLSFHYI